MGLRAGVAIDLGTVNSLVHVLGRGLVVEEPSVVGRDRRSRAVAIVGGPAERQVGREPVDMEVVHPLRDGVVSDLDAATAMLKAFLCRARFHTSALPPRAVMCVPSGANSIERQALVATAAAGHPRLCVRLVDEPVAAAVGAGSDPVSGSGVLVVDVGGGTTEAAVVMGGQMVDYRSLRIGGNAMDDAVVRAVRTTLGVRISQREAERLKFELGLAVADQSGTTVVGIDTVTGALHEVPVDVSVVADALARPVAAITDAVTDLVSAMPPGIARDVAERGIQLAGGGAQLRGFAARLAGSSGIGVVVSHDPLRTVVRGAAQLLEEHFTTLAEAA